MFASQHTFRYTRNWKEVKTSVRVSQNLDFFARSRFLVKYKGTFCEIRFNILKIVQCIIIWYRSEILERGRKHLGMYKYQDKFFMNSNRQLALLLL